MNGVVRRFAVAVALLACTIPAACTGGQDSAGFSAGAAAKDRPLILATTTSTQDSGLLDVLVPAFTQATGWQVKTVAVGTGEALAMGRRGDADVLLVHAPAAEQQVVDQGHAVDRRAVMHNDFVLLGPVSDPVGVRGASDAPEALRRIARAGARWVSRGDDSGTHKKEASIWKAAGVEPAWEGYVSVGQGMGATLRIATEKQAYTLSDRATFLAADHLDLVIVLEGVEGLLNPYHVMRVNPAGHPGVNEQGALDFADFLVGARGQQLIRDFRRPGIDQPLFFPDGR